MHFFHKSDHVRIISGTLFKMVPSMTTHNTYVLDNLEGEVGSIWGLCVWDVSQRSRHLQPYPFTVLCEKSIYRAG